MIPNEKKHANNKIKAITTSNTKKRKGSIQRFGKISHVTFLLRRQLRQGADAPNRAISVTSARA